MISINDLNQHKDNIVNIKMGKVYTEFMRNVFNNLGRIDKMKPDFKCYIKTDGLLPEIVLKLRQYKGIKCEVVKNHIVYENKNAISFLSSIYDNNPRDRSEDLYKTYLETIFN